MKVIIVFLNAIVDYLEKNTILSVSTMEMEDALVSYIFSDSSPGYGSDLVRTPSTGSHYQDDGNKTNVIQWEGTFIEEEDQIIRVKIDKSSVR